MKKLISSRVSSSPSRFLRITSCGLNRFPLTSCYQNDGLSRNCKPLPYSIQTFSRFSFNTHTRKLHCQYLGDVLTHRENIRTKLGTLENDRGVDVYHVDAALV